MKNLSILAAFALPFLASAAPSQPLSRLPHPFFPRQDNASDDATCDLSKTPQPANTLTPPAADLSLVLIALGKGTQNYTCANAAATPTAIGAVAQLFNASCTVAEGGNLGSISEDAAAIGAHFFVDATTPDFDIIGLGNTEAKKAESMAAPAASAVPWLRLEAQVQGTTSPVKQIYRLNTVGGVAPANCAGQADGAVVTVDYQAQYWVYATTTEVVARRRRRVPGAGRRP